MKKVRIEDLKVFRTVADVIGETRAKCELFKLQWRECGFNDVRTLAIAFAWSATPQGRSFWLLINRGVNPYAK